MTEQGGWDLGLSELYGIGLKARLEFDSLGFIALEMLSMKNGNNNGNAFLGLIALGLTEQQPVGILGLIPVNTKEEEGA